MIIEVLNVGLTSTGLLTFAIGAAVHERFMRVGETSPVRVFGAIVALMQAQMLMAALIVHSSMAPFSAAGLAASLYVWWNSGGGGGISKIFRAIRSRLSIIRTAPQGA